MTADDRAEYIAGLRALADLLEANEGVPLPTTGRTNAFDWWFHGSGDVEPKTALGAVVRLLPGSKDKEFGEGSGSSWFTVKANLRGLRIDLNAARSKVCTRVVKGTREVTEEILDPDALAAVPTTTVTRTVEDVEWVCEPLLAERHDELEPDVDRQPFDMSGATPGAER